MPRSRRRSGTETCLAKPEPAGRANSGALAWSGRDARRLGSDRDRVRARGAVLQVHDEDHRLPPRRHGESRRADRGIARRERAVEGDGDRPSAATSSTITRRALLDYLHKQPDVVLARSGFTEADVTEMLAFLGEWPPTTFLPASTYSDAGVRARLAQAQRATRQSGGRDVPADRAARSTRRDVGAARGAARKRAAMRSSTRTACCSRTITCTRSCSSRPCRRRSTAMRSARFASCSTTG